MPRTRLQTKSDSEAKEGKKRELEEYAQAHFKYTKLFQDQADAMRHDPEEMNASHARITAESLAVQSSTPFTPMTVEYAQKMMVEYARRCEDKPQTFDDRMRISFAASFYLQAMLQVVLQDPARPQSDFKTVIGRAAQLFREHHSGQPAEIPTITQAIVNFTPEVKESRPTSLEEIEYWRSHPDELVGLCFISTAVVRRVFLVDGYSIRNRKGPQYYILYEDSGLKEVHTIDPETLLEMVAEAELVENAF